MNERLVANVLSGHVGIFFGLTLAGICMQNSVVAVAGFLLLICFSILRWSYWHREGE
jgi:hypothetical protein